MYVKTRAPQAARDGPSFHRYTGIAPFRMKQRRTGKW
jgi:hypothetical protein